MRQAQLGNLILAGQVPQHQVDLLAVDFHQLFVDFCPDIGEVAVAENALHIAPDQAGLPHAVGSHHADFLLEYDVFIRHYLFCSVTRTETPRLKAWSRSVKVEWVGFAAPALRTVSSLAGTPEDTSALRTSSARSKPSRALRSSEPDTSVCPTN